MNWDQPEYSFGNPNAQPPTPTQTPTSATFPSPSFQTPRNNPDTDNRAGWTPVFAEEYSVFNATPGRLTSSSGFVQASTPQIGTTPSQRRPSTERGSSHVNLFSPTPNLSQQPADELTQNSPEIYKSGRNRFDDSSRKKVTPRPPKKRLEEAFSGQTATPPASASKGSRKLAPKFSKETMQNDPQGGHYGSSQTPTQPYNLMAFPSTSSQFFNFPMSASAIAPAYSGSKPFWDPDASMGGMDLDLSAADEAQMFNTGSHKMDNSFDWGRDNQIFQDPMALPPSGQLQTASRQENRAPAKRQRPLAPKLAMTSAELSTSMAPFDFSATGVSDDPFSAATMDGVDPGLLFGPAHGHSHSQSNSVNMTASFADVPLPAPRPATSHVELKPYQHQLRESKRDQEELRHARSSRDGGKARRYERSTVSSPIKGSARPGLQRSVSDNRGKRTQERVLSRTGSGRISPLKHQRPGSLTSIPEQPPRLRTEVKFMIDSNGRARTETILVEEELKTRRGGPSSRSSREDDLDSDHYVSSTDEEPILLPSQPNSFALPQPKVPKLARFETSRGPREMRRHSASAYSQSETSSQRSMRRDSIESEAETVVDEGDGSGDATLELRKIMEDRKRQQMMSRNPRHHLYVPASTSRNQYAYSSSTNISPTTITDPNGATPSSSRSGTTRCVCNNPESEGFMIQCDACENWLHAECVGVDRRSLPPVYVCAYCAQTPNMRGGRIRDTARAAPSTHLGSSPLAHKSFKSFR